jgi:dienelactone hydrolase
MLKLSGLVAELRTERDRAQKKVEQLNAALSAVAGLVHAGGRSPQSRARKRRRPMSAAARKRIAAAQRALGEMEECSVRSDRIGRHSPFTALEMEMRCLISVLTLVLIAPLAAQTGVKPAAEFPVAVHFFDYDQKQPLDIHDKIIEEFAGGTLHEVSYTSPKGGPVAAYLIVPTGKGPFAAVLFGHWGNGTRAEFIPEAKIYARAGAVSLIPDYPWDRPQPWHKTPDHFDKPEVDREIEIQAVVDLRRGIDLLLARPDVDPSRLAYVGHSYGAQWGSILSAVDKRMKTSILMAGVAEMADILLRSDDPGMVDFRRTQPAGQLEKYSQVTGDIDAIHFVGNSAPIPLLLQFANYEQYFDKTSMQHYVAAASEPKKVLYYDTGHDLNDPQALADRYHWLVKYINLRGEPVGQTGAQP